MTVRYSDMYHEVDPIPTQVATLKGYLPRHKNRPRECVEEASSWYCIRVHSPRTIVEHIPRVLSEQVSHFYDSKTGQLYLHMLLYSVRRARDHRYSRLLHNMYNQWIDFIFRLCRVKGVLINRFVFTSSTSLRTGSYYLVYSGERDGATVSLSSFYLTIVDSCVSRLKLLAQMRSTTTVSVLDVEIASFTSVSKPMSPL